MSLSFDGGFSEPWYDGSGILTSGGYAYPASLGGIPYMYDYTEEFTHGSVPLQRGAVDDQNNVGRQTLNPEAFWSRTFESWHVGAGQSHFDRRDPTNQAASSNPFRFRRSRGVDVWDRYQLSLLNATDKKLTSANTNLRMAVAGDYLYVLDGTAIRRTGDVTVGTPSFTAITGVPGVAPSSIASDGYNILTAHGASGIYKTTRGAATTASHITGNVSDVAYGKGRWVATNGPSLYDITTLVFGAATVLPSALFTHSNTDFVWNCFAEGPTALYVGGYSGDKSLIYRLTMREDGTGLNQPVVAGFLPDGELIHSMQGYLGFVLIGTSAGVRMGVVGGQGDLTVGALIPTDGPVQCFEGQDKFVWYGWSGFENGDSGLGRVNLETFSDTEALVPAYASDLMSDTSGAVLSCVTFQGIRVFTVSGAGMYAEDTAVLVDEGQIDCGVFDYGLIEEKLSLYIDISFVSTGGTAALGISLDRSDFVTLATLETADRPVATGEARAAEFELRLTLCRDSSDTDLGPVIRSFGLRAQPATPMTKEIIAPLLIAPEISRLDGVREPMNTAAAAEHIEDLCETKRVVVYQQGAQAWSVIVADFKLIVHKVYGGDQTQWGLNATAVCRLKTVV